MLKTRQQEKFIVLMENYGKAVDYTTASTESAGTAMEKFTAYTSSVEGKMNSLKAQFEQLSTALLDSDVVAGFITALTGLLTVATELLTFADGAVIKIGLVVGAVLAGQFAFKKLQLAVAKAKNSYTEFIRLQQALAGSQAAQLTTTELLTAATIKYTSTGLIGVITTIPRAIIAIGKWIVSMFSASGATLTFKAALEALQVNPVILAIEAAALALWGFTKILGAVDKAWQDEYDSALENAEKHAELVKAYDEEINTLETLQEKLEDAKGDRSALAEIYDELNKHISVSTGLLKGEEAAYDAANQQLKDQIKYKERLRDISLDEEIENREAAFMSNSVVRTGAFGWDWAMPDKSGSDVRAQARARAELLYSDDPGERHAGRQLEQLALLRDGEVKYWNQQVDLALQIFDEYIAAYNGVLDMGLVVEEYTRAGYVPEEIRAVTQDLESSMQTLDELQSAYYEAGESGDIEKADRLYEDIVAEVERLKDEFPIVSDMFKSALVSITKYTTENIDYTAKSFLEILKEVEGGYDAVADAMKDMAEYGYLTSDSVSTILSEFPELAEFLTLTANGYTMCSDALERYIELSGYKYANALLTAKEGTAAYTKALEEFQRYLAVIATLQLDNSKQEAETNKSKLDDQLDAYKELIDLRKELLETYADELEYQEELRKKQENVSNLQTKLAVSRLDTSAAGQARTRELEAELKEAQEDLDDFTLEHAIETLTRQLDEQYEQYKQYIEAEVKLITDSIEALKGTNAQGFSNLEEMAKSLMTSHAERVITEQGFNPARAPFADNFNDIKNKPWLNGGNVTSSSSSNSSSNDTGSFLGNLIQNTLEKAAARANASGKIESSVYSVKGVDSDYWWDDDMDVTVGGKTYPAVGSETNATSSEIKALNAMFGSAAPKVGSIAALNGELYIYKYRKDGKGTEWAKMLHDQWNEDEFKTLKNKLLNTLVSVPEYHTGGAVGNHLGQNEEFAKLMKGEFVSTPSQMRKFMTDTLPSIANFDSADAKNEFNAPLISIECENVTSESMPRLESIVKSAVTEIQKQLDNGVSRTGYKHNRRKLLT